MKIVTSLRCFMGWHELFSLADYYPETTAALLLPKKGDSVEDIMRKFRETTMIRCRHCPYTYDGDR
jgi:hypothetical protein